MTKIKFPYTKESLKDFKKANEIRCPKCNKKAAESKGKDVVLEIWCKCKHKYIYNNGQYLETVKLTS